MIRIALVAGISLLAAPAFAQTTFEAPRFEALELQNQMQDQNRIDHLEKQKQDFQTKALNPASRISEATNAVTQLQLQEQTNRVMLEIQQERDRVGRESTIRDLGLPNRRIAASSILVVSDPYVFALPPAPKGQYYARLNGHFVLVDRTSELVVAVLPDRPGDPTNDKPVEPPPPLLPAIPADQIYPDPPPREPPVH